MAGWRVDWEWWKVCRRYWEKALREGGLRRRERTGASRRERREEESSGTGRATSSLFLDLVESLLGWVLQLL